MKTVSKRMMLKGAFPCILTISGGSPASVKAEWLRAPTDEPIRLFQSTEKSFLVHGDSAELAAETVIAAAIGTALHTKGQLAAFDWIKAEEYLRLLECSSQKPPISKSIFKEPGPVSSASAKPNLPPNCPCKSSPVPIKTQPFPQNFPESEWLRHEYPSANGSWHYLTGTIYKNGTAVASATAVPGKYSVKPPAWLKEFSLFLNCPENRQGYWIAVTPIFTNSTKTEEI